MFRHGSITRSIGMSDLMADATKKLYPFNQESVNDRIKAEIETLTYPDVIAWLLRLEHRITSLEAGMADEVVDLKGDIADLRHRMP